MKTTRIPLATIALTVIAIASSHAASVTDYSMIITTSEGVGAFNSSLSGTSVQTFDNLLGVNKNVVWEGVGTFDQLNVIKADVYGGAPSENPRKAPPTLSKVSERSPPPLSSSMNRAPTSASTGPPATLPTT